MADLGTGAGSSYPSAIDTSTNVVNNVDTVTDDDFNDQSVAIIAVQSTLGTNPQGSKTDVKSFLQTEHGTNGTHDVTKVGMLAGEQLFTGNKYFRKYNFGIDTGIADAYVVSPISSFSSSDLVNGLQILVEIVEVNTGISTLNIGGTGAKTIKRYNQSGAIVDVLAGHIGATLYHWFTYDLTNDVYILLNPVLLLDDDIVVTSKIADLNVTTGKIANLAVTEGKIGADAVDWDTKIKLGTDGEIPTWGTDTNPTRIPVGTSGHPLIGKGAGAVAVFEQVVAVGIANSAIEQAHLKTTTGDMAQAVGNVVEMFTGPGGEYGFWPTVKASAGGSASISICTPLSSGSFSIGTSFVNRFVLNYFSGSQKITARQRYIQASPPYNLGDGDIHTFIFAKIENGTGILQSLWIAPDPPWANNGPTNIRPTFMEDGKFFITRKQIDLTKPLMHPDRITEVTEEITSAFKNTDMPLIPHPFIGGDMVNKSIVMIDSFTPLALRLHEEQQAGGDVLDLFLDGDVVIGNTKINGRQTPNGVDIHPITLR